MIYIISPGNIGSGGSETLHQLGALLKSRQYDVAMYYIYPHTMQTAQSLVHYKVDVVDCIVDEKTNILIVPEYYTEFIYKYRRIKLCIWWLSLDFYFRSKPVNKVMWIIKEYGRSNYSVPFEFVRHLVKGRLNHCFNKKYNFKDKREIFHLYNCEYAHSYLIKMGIQPERMLYLCGPLNEAFFKVTPENVHNDREPVVLYNPHKGRIFTQKIIDVGVQKGISFFPIKGMKPAEIVELMSNSSAYMDFGDFPGPERIPREAVLMGCNIITSRNGSAGDNDVDVPIPSFLKFEDRDENVPRIIEILLEMLDHYDKYYHYYDEYRKKIWNQRMLFENNTTLFLDIIEKM